MHIKHLHIKTLFCKIINRDASTLMPQLWCLNSDEGHLINIKGLEYIYQSLFDCDLSILYREIFDTDKQIHHEFIIYLFNLKCRPLFLLKAWFRLAGIFATTLWLLICWCITIKNIFTIRKHVEKYPRITSCFPPLNIRLFVRTSSRSKCQDIFTIRIIRT